MTSTKDPTVTITLAPGHEVGNELRLLDGVIAGLFDLDGVLTNTAAVHDKAWKEMFDSFLHQRSERRGESPLAS